MKLTKNRVLIGALVLLVGSFVFQKLISDDDERQIKRTIELFATSTSPARCEKATDAYLEQITGAKPPFADDICEAEASDPATDSVDVSEVSIDGDRATALVAYTGGLLDGSESRIGLIERDGDWKVDRRISFIHFDRVRFRRAYRTTVGEFSSGKDGVRCALGREGRLTDADVERALLENGADSFTRIAVVCDRDGVERGIRAALAEAGLDSRGTECAERELASAGNARLIGIQVDPSAYGRLIVSCDRSAMVDHFKRGLVGEEDRDPRETACLVAAFGKLSSAAQFRLPYEDDRYEALYERCEA